MKVDLFFCGDSFTYGAELQGLEDDHEKRKKERFSTLVSDSLGKTHDNVSKNGACNDWIVKSVVDWFESGNECHTAFIQFSHYRRWGWYEGDQYRNMTQHRDHISHQHTDVQQQAHEAYWKFVRSESNDLDNYWKNKFFIKNYLKDKCKVHFTTLSHIPYGNKNLYKNNFWYNLVKDTEISSFKMIVDGEFTEKYNDTNLTGRHPNTIGHQLIADHLLSIVKREN